MNFSLPMRTAMFFLFSIPFLSQSQITDVYTTPTTWNVPAGVHNITIKVYGGGGGTGGLDCGAGCTNAAAGPVGYVVATYSVTPGDVIGIYPGGKGVNGSNNVASTGGGNGGVSPYNVAYNGGKGGNAGNTGASGGGGGGGAASIITINSTISIVAGGAGGGGGMANLAGSGLPGNSATSANGSSNTGGIGTTPGGDGGGGGGGGGGQFGSIGGAVHAAGGENAGDGGFRGGNAVSGATTVTSNTFIAWTTAGQIEITYSSTLPVTWLSFTAAKQATNVVLQWSTATEQNTMDYTVQHSIDGINWISIAGITAATNSNTIRQYSFVHQTPVTGTNYYRLVQNDIDGRKSYSNIVAVVFAGKAKSFSILSNPVVNGVLTVSSKKAEVLRLYNSMGEKVMERKITAGSNTINLSHLPKGHYYVQAGADAMAISIQ